MSPLYHGSDEDWLEELDGNEPGYTGSLGYGLYLTTDPDFAAIFGKHIYEVESPVPDELVAQIEPMTYECGNDLTFYTTGSVPFSFDIVDRKTGETYRYSVLGDCEEQVREALRRQVLEDFTVSDELKAEVRANVPSEAMGLFGKAAEAVLEAFSESQRVDDQIDLYLDVMANSGVDGDVLDREVKPLLEALEREIEEFADEKIAQLLGDEIDLDELSRNVERHGYSAFFIEGYAPGNEYVIFDDKYLPISVEPPTSRPRR
jgi:hypothetical protein